MSDIDHVFARLGGGQPASTTQRELRHIPRKGGPAGSRVVEVVRLPAGRATHGKDESRRPGAGVRAATWEDGFPARSAPPVLPSRPPATPEDAVPAEPVAHVMPMWERMAPEPEAVPVPPAPAAEPAPAPSAGRPRRAERNQGRRIADPYDAADEGANCLRCGYAIESARERRGLMTCAGCG